jgi:uncharacterized alpha-E superfamily protein
MVRGTIDATLLPDAGYNFLNLGFYLESGDSTARLIDVKYYVLLLRIDYVGSGLDNDQWMMLLRAMGSHPAFRLAYGGDLPATKIADFLILNPQCSRSLITCVAGMANHLDRLAKLYDHETTGQAAVHRVLAELNSQNTEKIFDEGLHEFLTRFVDQIVDLGGVIHNSYLLGDMTLCVPSRTITLTLGDVRCSWQDQC